MYSILLVDDDENIRMILRKVIEKKEGFKVIGEAGDCITAIEEAEIKRPAVIFMDIELPDGNGEFTDGMGLLVEKDALGFGKRSWRYSMLVKNGIIEKMFIEAETPGDPFGVSDADTMLNYINPNAKAPASITILSKPSCPFCKKAKAMLDKNNLAYEEIVIGDAVSPVTIRALSGQSGVPQIFIDGKLIGGSTELEEYLK